MRESTVEHRPQQDHLSERHNRRRWYALLILSLSLMLVIIDGTIVNIAIPSIQSTFDSSIRDVEWVNSIYSLFYAATLILWGKIGDQYGRRLLFVAGLLLFGVGSALVGASSSIGMLIAMRAIQGLGAAVLSPSTLSIITTTFKDKERGIAFGIWGATAGVAAALGPLLGGWIITNAAKWEWTTSITPDSWRWAFFINIPIVAAALVGSFWAIRESRDEHASHRLDVAGSLLGGLGLGGIVFGLIEGENYGWWSPKGQFAIGSWEWPLDSLSIVPLSLIGGAILLAIFVWYELRLERTDREPLFEFSLLRYASFRFGMLTGLIVNLGELGILFALSIFLQSVKGLSAFDTGVALVPLALASLIAAPMAGSFSSRIGPKWIVTAGMTFEAASLFWMSRIISPDVSVNTLAVPLAVYGLGLGLAIAQLTSLTLFDIPGPKSGIAAGANSTIRQVGAALGIAIIGTVLSSTQIDSADQGLRSSELLSSPPFVAMRDQILVALHSDEGMNQQDMIAMTSGSAGESGMPAGGTEGQPPAGVMGQAQATETPADQAGDAMPADAAQGMPEGASMGQGGSPVGDPGQEIKTIFFDALSDATANSALTASIFVALGAISSLLLPNRRDDEAPDAA
ncbi:MAG TPA: MFS transporter [Aggregatilinea sp.]|uniref:MFS transporter n=1 Tax=Aggregatilinea sp. TaxID=2806333 RepID=UPI002D18F626|nr:MFS transporter [Aggregatilinea sp.]HML22736.1 MFS transporter [Aggregatilinea sp.]